MDFAMRLDSLKQDIKMMEADPVYMVHDNEVEMDSDVPSAMKWLAERQESLTNQSLSSNGLLTEPLMRDDTQDTTYDFDIQFSSKSEITRALHDIQRLEKELKCETQKLSAMKIEEISVAVPLVVQTTLESHHTEEVEVMRKQMVLAQQRKREEQKKARQIEEKLCELKAESIQEEQKLAEYNRTISDMWSELRSTVTVEIVEVETQAVLKLPVGLLYIPWKGGIPGTDAARLDASQSSFIPRGSHTPVSPDAWQRVMRSCSQSIEELRMADLLMHVIEYYGDDEL